MSNIDEDSEPQEDSIPIQGTLMKENGENMTSKEENNVEKSSISNESNDEIMDTPDTEYVEKEIETDLPSDTPMITEESDTISTEASIEEPKQEKLTRFPMGRIKHIMKMDPDVRVVTPEATFLVSKSLELFVESLVWEAHRYTEQSRKKTMQKHDVDRAIDGVDALAFLEGALDD